MVARPRPGSSLAVQITSAGATPPPERLPRHAHGLSRDEVSRSQRARIVRAVAEAVAQKGYAATTVADVIARAGVSRSTFYELYDGKEDAFLAAYAGLDLVVRRLVDVSRDAASPAEMVRAGVRAHLAGLAAEPAFTWMFFVEAVAAGPRILARRRAATERFLDGLEEMVHAARRLDPTVPEPDRMLLLGFVGAVRELVTTHLLRADPRPLTVLEPAVVRLAERLLLGSGGGGPTAADGWARGRAGA